MISWKYIVCGGCTLIGCATYYLVNNYFAGLVCKCPKTLEGHIIVITGGNSEIGKILALELAQRGAILILACRDIEKGIEAKNWIISALKNEVKIYVEKLDLCSFKSIRDFATKLKKKFVEIYALVNNAGIFSHPQMLTEDGFDVTFQTNYLGPFILSHMLLPLLKKHSDGKIVNISSDAHRNISSTELFTITKYQEHLRTNVVAYGVSKLAIHLFTKEMSQNLLYTRVTVNSANPGYTDTKSFRNLFSLANPWLYIWPIQFILRTPNQGAQTALHILLNPDRNLGLYFSNCRPVTPSRLADNYEVVHQYYQLTLKILGDKFNNVDSFY